MKINAAGIAQRFNMQPALLAEQHVADLSNLMASASAPSDKDVVPYDEMCASAFGFDDINRDKPFVFADGLAFISVSGVLLHRLKWSGESATGYDYIRTRFEAAMADPDVKGVVLDVNSPGGQVLGNFEMAESIYQGRKQKPVLALVDGGAYSGGYSLASAATKIVASPSSGVGSIGVVAMHVSVEKALDNMGIEVTFLYAGKHKIDGTPFKALSEDARARFQKVIEKSYTKFVDLVARNRGLESEAVRATEALTYDAEDALSLGLIDAISTPREALAAFRKELSGSITTGGSSMTTQTQPGANANAPETAPNPSAIEQAAADARTAERQRIAAITGCEQANGRKTLAEHLAHNTDMTVEDAQAVLAAAPTEQAAAPQPAAGQTPFERAMAETPNPEVGAAGDGGNAQVSGADAMIAAYNAATGEKYKTH